MLATAVECTGGEGESSKGRQFPQPCRQDDCEGAPDMAVTGQLQGQTTTVHPHNGILFGNKMEWTTGAHDYTDEPQMYYVK